MPGGQVGRDIKVFRDLGVGLAWMGKPAMHYDSCVES